MIDYNQRLARLRTQMEAQNAGLVFLTPGANLFYLTGIPHRDVYRTDHNSYGDWAVGAYIGLKDGIILVSPRMGGDYYLRQTETKPWFESVRMIHEIENPLDIMRQVLQRFNLKEKRILIEDHAWAETTQVFRSLIPNIELGMASTLIAPMRMIKDPEELELMRKSGQVCQAAFLPALSRLKLGITAWEVECEINFQMRKMGADFNSFPTNVIFTNPNKDPHRILTKTERHLEPGDAVAFDFGCIYQGYASDFGRTAFAGDPPKEYLRIHQLVIDAQRAGIQALKAGQLTAGEADRPARKVITEGGYGDAFRHRTGHGIGITVHEPPFLDGVDITLIQEGMTFTVEPSIFIQEGYANRVEDVVLVTPQGGQPLYDADRRLYLVD